MSTVTPSKDAPVAPSGIKVLDHPVTEQEKAAYVREMFDDIAHRYDLLNSVLSAGIHKGWRGFAARCACLEVGNSVLDVCSGNTASGRPRCGRRLGRRGLSWRRIFRCRCCNSAMRGSGVKQLRSTG